MRSHASYYTTILTILLYLLYLLWLTMRSHASAPSTLVTSFDIPSKPSRHAASTCVFEQPASCLRIAPSALTAAGGRSWLGLGSGVRVRVKVRVRVRVRVSFTAAGGRPAARTPRVVGWLSPLGRAAVRAEGRGWATAPLGWDSLG